MAISPLDGVTFEYPVPAGVAQRMVAHLRSGGAGRDLAFVKVRNCEVIGFGWHDVDRPPARPSDAGVAEVTSRPMGVFSGVGSSLTDDGMRLSHLDPYFFQAPSAHPLAGLPPWAEEIAVPSSYDGLVFRCLQDRRILFGSRERLCPCCDARVGHWLLVEKRAENVAGPDAAPAMSEAGEPGNPRSPAERDAG
jgi:hypothetical protein